MWRSICLDVGSWKLDLGHVLDIGICRDVLLIFRHKEKAKLMDCDANGSHFVALGDENRNDTHEYATSLYRHNCNTEFSDIKSPAGLCSAAYDYSNQCCCRSEKKRHPTPAFGRSDFTATPMPLRTEPQRPSETYNNEHQITGQNCSDNGRKLWVGQSTMSGIRSRRCKRLRRRSL